jgi:hypothetical protein
MITNDEIKVLFSKGKLTAELRAKYRKQVAEQNKLDKLTAYVTIDGTQLDLISLKNRVIEEVGYLKQYLFPFAK